LVVGKARCRPDGNFRRAVVVGAVETVENHVFSQDRGGL